MSKNAEILEASEDISDAGGWGSIRGLKRTEEPLFCQKSCFFSGYGLRSRYIVRWSLE
ncbi:hypothetical protein PRIO_0657 [Paenibacillus riograndensis SBR5]|uniref:Uncharacterized protein n=1 Tax=Paenibacillus riograndensis SBR5 TaxID=1073571 RepID=A0A0E4H6W9_9BACL|nr:hypothetical protein PRIO_0657 [Paenibacillus riograndensis SBR5]